jgi:hypothetical protein
MRRYQEGEDLYNLIETAIPEFARAEYPMFVDFVKLFLLYLEQERTFRTETISSEYGALVNNQILTTDVLGGTAYEMRKFLEYRDIDTTLDDFAPHFLRMFAKNFPRRTFISAQRFVDTLRYLYTHKSVEDTVVWFFRVLFNEPAAIYYPREDILKASDGTWLEETTIKVGAPTNGYENEQLESSYLGQQIKTATGMAQVDRIRTTVLGQAYGQYLFVNELVLKRSSIVGTFAPDQDVWNLDSEPVIHTTILPVVTGVNVLSGGEQYAVGDIVTFSEGPGLGEGYGAAGVVTSVSDGPISSVRVDFGGDGYVVGDPVVFISSTGANAEAYVSEVVYGNINLDGEDGYILTEQQVANERVYIAQEDHNYIPQDLAITEFVNNTIAFNDADYSVAGQPTWNSETTLDYVFASIGSVPFMHPWCFGDWSGNSANVTLCNTMIVLDMTSHDTFCANLANVFALTSPTDLATTASNAVYKGLIVSANVTMGLNRNRLYVTNTTASFIIGQTVKCDGPYTTGIGEVTFANGSANVSGFGTNFTEVLQPGSFIYLGGIAEEFVVKSITNSSFLTLWTKPTSNGSGETWSIVPTGVVRSVTLQAQTNYGKIRRIAFISPGSGYLTPPVVTVDSVSARAQAIYYYDP